MEDKTKEELKSELRESRNINISLEVLKEKKAKALIIVNKELISSS